MLLFQLRRRINETTFLKQDSLFLSVYHLRGWLGQKHRKDLYVFFNRMLLCCIWLGPIVTMSIKRCFHSLFDTTVQLNFSVK